MRQNNNFVFDDSVDILSLFICSQLVPYYFEIYWGHRETAKNLADKALI